MEKELTNMTQFIQWIGRENYDLLVKNGKSQEGRYKNGIPFSDHVPVVRIVCPYETDVYEDENEFCLLSEVNDQENLENAYGYGICTFTSGLPVVGLIRIADLLKFRGYRNTILTIDKDFKAETTMGGYIAHYQTRGIYRTQPIPLDSWRAILMKEETEKYQEEQKQKSQTQRMPDEEPLEG